MTSQNSDALYICDKSRIFLHKKFELAQNETNSSCLFISQANTDSLTLVCLLNIQRDGMFITLRLFDELPFIKLNFFNKLRHGE